MTIMISGMLKLAKTFPFEMVMKLKIGEITLLGGFLGEPHNHRQC